MKSIDTKFSVIEIEWKRIFLDIKIRSNCNNDVHFFWARIETENIESEVIREQVNIDYYDFNENIYSFSLNMSALNGRSFLNNGKWKLYACVNDINYQVYVDEQVAYSLVDKDRVFRYNKNIYAYNCSFDLASDDYENMFFYLNSYFMVINKKWRKRCYIQEGTTCKEKIEKFTYSCSTKLINAYYKVFRCIFKVTNKVFFNKKKRILFMSETKENITGNLKAIYKRLYERGLDKSYNITIISRKAVGNNNSILSWIITITNIATNDFIFIDDYAPVFGFLKIDKNVKLVQVWHAGEGFKSVGYSRFGKNGSPFPSTSCHKAYDYALTASKKLIKVYEEVFGIEKEAFLPVGMPRLDGFLNCTVIEEFKSKFYNIYPRFKQKKIILFAPTYRGNGQKQAFYDIEKLDLNQIYDFCGEEYIFIIKLHPFISDKVIISENLKDRIYDFSNYNDINELYYVTEILITDYSSNFYEFSLMKKPIVFFTYDRAVYELTRGVHRNVRENAPGKVCDDFDELMLTLRTADFELEKTYEFAKENFMEYNYNASDRVIDLIICKE